MGTVLDDAEYVSLRSYRRDGRAVDTPVWVAPWRGKLVVFTLRDSYKVKRIRRTPRVALARCDVRGGLRGPWLGGEARIVTDPAEEKSGYAAFDAKYGLKMRIGTVFSTLVGRAKRRVLIEVALTGDAPAG